ncbi:chitinase [Dictyobacter vulcani]|uniref:chitinase n=1 Tax=Dictyobacter vulcani TaxID=2607529 RepID=A0A5J4KXK6_9CHLR|nr:glycosyl hydrolase family 18 protein [Dictyobacter vulcani]GER91277.1 chitinase [Dictyobacter vulcani]
MLHTKRLQVFSIFVLLGSMLILLFWNTSTGVLAADNNLLNNAGFETGNLNSWSCDSSNTVVSSPVHSGAYALQLNPTGSTTGQCTQTVAVQPNTAYTLSAYVNGSYMYIGANGYGNNWTNSGSYTKLSYTFTTGSTTSSVTIYIHGWYAQASGYADDFILAGPAGSGTPTPTGTTVPTPTIIPTATPTIMPTATPTPCLTCGSLPKHVLTGYWQDFTNNAPALRLSAVDAQYDLIAVAFANADASTPGGVTFSVDPDLSNALGGYTAAQFTSDIASLHAQGKKVIISVGGQNGTISVGDATAATNFAHSVYGIMKTYGFDGVDIDLENSVSPTYMGSALQQLSALAGSGLIITLAPQTIDMQSTSSAYFQLALNIKSILTIVNMQYYNSGSMNGCNGNVYSQGTEDFLTALACIQLQGGLRPDQVGLGLPATTSAAGGGYVAPSVINNALDCLANGSHCGSFTPAAQYSTIRGAMTWSINWDAASNYNFAHTVGTHLKALP